MVVLNIFFSPRASELFHTGNKKGLRSLYFKTLFYQSSSTLVLIFVLAILAPYILSFVGAEYSSALMVVYILLFGYALNSLWGPIPFLMIMTKYEYQAMWITFVAAVLNITLNLILIPIYGIIGAAVATVVSINARNACALIYILSKGTLSKNG